jgi:hypothetical protein
MPTLPRADASDLVFGPAADTFIVQDLPTTNFGAGSRLEVDHSADRHALLKFTVSGVGANPVATAALRLYNVNGSSRGGDVYPVSDNSWQENSVTWNTAPAPGPTPVASLGAVSANQWYSIDVTSVVTGDGTYSFRVMTTITDGADYTSKEGTAGFAPQLVVALGGGSSDTTPPTVSITSPSGGSTVSGVVSVQASASDNVGVTKVEFSVDGNLRGTSTSSPYSFSWDTASTSNGGHTLSAKAYDAAGNTGTSPAVNVSVSNSSGGGSTVVFAGAAGDLGATSRTDATLTALDRSGAQFFVALGDLSYGDRSPEQAWCDYVKSKLPTLGPAFPFELLVGNHEDAGGSDGSIVNFGACLPDRLGATLGPAGQYGVEYYFDYPASAPLVRMIMTAPDLSVGGVTYTYATGDSHYNWAASAIDGARSAGIPWVVVAMHKPGLSAGSHGGSVNVAFTNLLVQKKVDLVLEAHDHNYQRSKQLALGTGCSAVPYGSYDADCVVDDGSDSQYGKGAGSIFLIDGTGGESLSSVSGTSSEGPYFAKVNGSTYGFTKYTVTADRIDAQFVNSVGSFTDAFSIVGGSAPPSNRPPVVTNPGTQTSTEGQPVNLPIQASDADGDALSYGASGLPAGLAINAVTGIISGSVAPGAASGSPYSSTVTVSDGSLTGTASFTWSVTDNVAPTAPTVLTIEASTTGLLTDWTDNTEADLAGYNVYRGASATGTFSKLNTSPLSSSQYLDGGAPPNAVSYYRVTAVDSSANESAPGTADAHRGSIVFVGAASATGKGSSVTISRPAGTATGDLLLTGIAVRTGATISAAGWTVIQEKTSPSSVMRQVVFSRVVSSSDPSSYVFTFSSQVGFAGLIVAYRGVGTIEASGGQGNQSSSSITAPPVTAASAESVEVGFFGIGRSASISPPPGMSELAEVTRASGPSNTRVTLEGADEVVTAGSIASRVAAASGAAENVGEAIVLNPTP